MPPRSLLITGASSGIGEALALHYARPGSVLALSGRDRARLEAVAEACRAKGAEATATPVEVTDRAAMREWVEAADDRAPLDLVFANAGITGRSGHGLAETAERVTEVFAVNVGGVLNTAYPAFHRMAARRRGQVALMASLVAFHGMPDSAAYSASKAAVKSLAESWRGSLAREGLRVSVICPGFIESRITARQDFYMPFLMPADRAAAIIAKGLERDRALIAFPLPMTALCRLLDIMPANLSSRLLERLARKS